VDMTNLQKTATCWQDTYLSHKTDFDSCILCSCTEILRKSSFSALFCGFKLSGQDVNRVRRKLIYESTK